MSYQTTAAGTSLHLSRRGTTKHDGFPRNSRAHRVSKSGPTIWMRPDVLIIDNMGMRQLSFTEAQDLCEIIKERLHGKSPRCSLAAAAGSLV